MLKAEKRFLYELNTVAGEQTIKASRFALIYADLVVLAHTNEYEYNSYFGNKENEAMIDRIFVVRVPYNLRLTEEIKIYEKLIGQSQMPDERTDLTRVHIAPHTLRVASMFAILTRLKPSKKSGLSLMTKLKLYDGEKQVGDWDQKHIRELQEEFMDEGMSGVSPRFVINRISAALVKGGKGYVTPIDVLRSLRDGLQEYTTSEEDHRRLLGFIDETRKDYDELAKKEVQRAFVYSYEESAKTLLDNYLDNVDAFCNRTKVKDPITSDDVDPDERLMRSIEEQIGVSENAKREFREGIMRSRRQRLPPRRLLRRRHRRAFERGPGEEAVLRPQGHRQDHDQHQDPRPGATAPHQRRGGSPGQRPGLHRGVRQRTPQVRRHTAQSVRDDFAEAHNPTALSKLWRVLCGRGGWRGGALRCPCPPWPPCLQHRRHLRA